MGEQALLDVVAGAIQAGVEHLSVYAFSTENWRRSPDEVRFLMGFNRDVLRRRREQLDAWNVRMRWAGRKPRLWGSVINELKASERATRGNTGLTLTMCVNYGGRNELTDAVRQIAAEVKAGRLSPGGITERTIERHLYVPELPDVDLFLRSSGSSARAISCCGNRHMPRWCFSIPSGPISDERNSGGRSRSITRGIVASAAPSTRRQPPSLAGRPSGIDLREWGRYDFFFSSRRASAHRPHRVGRARRACSDGGHHQYGLPATVPRVRRRPLRQRDDHESRTRRTHSCIAPAHQASRE